MAINHEPRALEMSSPPIVTIANLKKIDALLKSDVCREVIPDRDIPFIFRRHVGHHRPNDRKRNNRPTTQQPRQRRQPHRAQRKDIGEPQHNRDYGGIQDKARDTEADG